MSPSYATRYPTTPCSAGGRPVTSDVSALAVVLGATEVIVPPTPDAKVGASASRARSCSEPRPSRTRSTTCEAPASGAGIHDGSGSDP